MTRKLPTVTREIRAEAGQPVGTLPSARRGRLRNADAIGHDSPR